MYSVFISFNTIVMTVSVLVHLLAQNSIGKTKGRLFEAIRRVFIPNLRPILFVRRPVGYEFTSAPFEREFKNQSRTRPSLPRRCCYSHHPTPTDLALPSLLR